MKITYSIQKVVLYFLLLIPTLVYSQPIVEKHLVGKSIERLKKEDKSLSFLVVGDWGKNGQSAQQDVADMMGVAAAQINARFVLSTGDNIYPTGVASADDPQWWFSFENVYRCHSLNIPWYASLGNHDYNGNSQAQLEYSRKSMRWKMPARYYTMAINDIRFICIDTNPFVINYHKRKESYPELAAQDTIRQLQWLDSVLTNSKEQWKIVFGHHPIYSVGNHDNQPELHTQLKPMLEKHKVDIYFSGHEHNLQYHYEQGKSLHYLGSGAGGAEHTPIRRKDKFTQFAKETNGFMSVQATKEAIIVHLIDDVGTVIYQTKIEKTK